jgi:hypothetical protein
MIPYLAVVLYRAKGFPHLSHDIIEHSKTKEARLGATSMLFGEELAKA